LQWTIIEKNAIRVYPVTIGRAGCPLVAEIHGLLIVAPRVGKRTSP
jgi:hypothetical protein